jgi:hypothetical protein
LSASQSSCAAMLAANAGAASRTSAHVIDVINAKKRTSCLSALLLIATHRVTERR